MIARKNSLCEKCKNKKIHKKHSIIPFKELSLFLKNFSVNNIKILNQPIIKQQLLLLYQLYRDCLDNKLFLPNCLFYSNLFFILNKQTIKKLNFIVKRPLN